MSSEVLFGTSGDKGVAAPWSRFAASRSSAWRVRLRKERGLAEAMRIAGPFVLSSQGPLPGAGAGAERSQN